MPEPGFARVDPLRGRVSGLLQERESETIDHERSGKIPSAQVSIETGQLHYARTTASRSLERRQLEERLSERGGQVTGAEIRGSGRRSRAASDLEPLVSSELALLIFPRGRARRTKY